MLFCFKKNPVFKMTLYFENQAPDVLAENIPNTVLVISAAHCRMWHNDGEFLHMCYLILLISASDINYPALK